MASECKCYCSCSLDIYMLASEAFAIWLTWNWNIADCSNCLLLRWDFEIERAFAPLGHEQKKAQRKRMHVWMCAVHFQTKNYICQFKVRPVYIVECVCLFRIRQIQHNFFFATLRQFVNDLNNLWDGSIINFRYARKHFGSLLKCVCVRLNASKHILTVCKWIW